MKRIILSILLLSFATGIVTSCTPINAQETPSYEHVIILGFDGWGASSFNDANMPFLKISCLIVYGLLESVHFCRRLVLAIGPLCSKVQDPRRMVI